MIAKFEPGGAAELAAPLIVEVSIGGGVAPGLGLRFN